MAGRLVTVARFDLAGQAHLAKNALEAAGIKAVLTDEAIVAMDWLLSNAVGGIKVQVLEENADRAVTVLEAALGSEEPLDEEAMAAEAEAFGPEEEPEAASAPVRDRAEDRPLETGSERDLYARRAALAAFFSLVVAPLWFYALYLFFNAALGYGSISDSGRKKVLIGGCFLALGLPMAFFVIPFYAKILP